jgi:hypothetical protein
MNLVVWLFGCLVAGCIRTTFMLLDRVKTRNDLIHIKIVDLTDIIL